MTRKRKNTSSSSKEYKSKKTSTSAKTIEDKTALDQSIAEDIWNEVLNLSLPQIASQYNLPVFKGDQIPTAKEVVNKWMDESRMDVKFSFAQIVLQGKFMSYFVFNKLILYIY